jgi:hypothetical protein
MLKNPRDAFRGQQEFYSDFHQQLLSTSDIADRKSSSSINDSINLNDVELGEYHYHSAIHSLACRTLSAVEECMEWAECYVFMFPHVYDDVVDAMEKHLINFKHKIYRRFSEYNHETDNPAEDCKLLAELNTANNSQVLWQIIEQVKKILNLLFHHGDSMFQRTPLGKSMLMFSALETIGSELEDCGCGLQVNENSNDALFPVLLYCLTIAGCQSIDPWQLWLQYRFIQQFRWSPQLSLGPGGWGFTNIAAIFHYLLANDENSEIFCLDNRPPLPPRP